MRCCRGGRASDFANEPQPAAETRDADTRQKLRKQLREGALDDREIELDIAQNVGVEIMAPPGMEEMTSQLRGMFQSLAGQRSQKRKMNIAQARPLLIEEEAGKLVNDEEIKTQAITNCEQNGIVFIDEIDKIAQRGEWGGARRFARRRAARSAAAGRRLGGVDEVRHRQDRSHPVHRIGRVLAGQAFRSRAGIAGPVSDPRRTCGADGRRFQADSFRAAERADQAIHRAARDRRRRRSNSPRMASRGSPRLRSRSTSAPRTSARGACIRCSSGCSTRSRSRRRTGAASTIASMRRTSTGISASLVKDEDLSRYILDDLRLARSRARLSPLPLAGEVAALRAAGEGALG